MLFRSLNRKQRDVLFCMESFETLRLLHRLNITLYDLSMPLYKIVDVPNKYQCPIQIARHDFDMLQNLIERLKNGEQIREIYISDEHILDNLLRNLIK